MKNNLLSPIMIFAGLLGVTGCALDSGGPLDTGGPIGSAAGENVATARQPLLGSAHAQAFGIVRGPFDELHDAPEPLGHVYLGQPLATGDLNGDGAEDMVVGISDAGPGMNVGAVDIIWGQKIQGASFGGLSTSSVTRLREPGTGNQEAHNRFGASVAVGDFNCDGHPDLAIGAPGDSIGSVQPLYQGSVSILYGPNFASQSWQLFWQGSAGIPGVPEEGDQFGEVLAVGNFNHDSTNGRACDDLAIGTPHEGIGSATGAGSVTILYGRSTGLNTSGAPAPQLWHQDVGTLFGVAEAGDHFGASLAVGDFNHDGKDDLAIGVPGEVYEGVVEYKVGLVQVMNGTSGGLTDVGNRVLQLNDFPGMSLTQAEMGISLAAGDFDGDGADDLAVGADLLTFGPAVFAGGVLVYRQMNGVLTASLQYNQNTANVPGLAETTDFCGFSLVAGDFNGDGHDDLASGCPGEGVTASGVREGALNVISFGVVSGALTIASAQLWDKDTTGIPGQCNDNDNFSHSLAAGDFNGDGKADLAASGQLSGLVDDGSVTVIYGAP